MTIENIKELMDGVDIAKLLPNIEAILAHMGSIARIALLLGPAVVLFLGLHYFLLAPKEANYTTGYRFFWGMASVESWKFMQQTAGIIWSLLGMGLLIAMGITGGELEEMALMDVLWVVVRRVALQAGLTLASCIVIDLIVFARFDRKGKRRPTWRELYQA